MRIPLHANVVLPGGTVAPDVFPNPGSPPPLLGDISSAFNLGSGKLVGTYEEVVLVDPLGVTCAGCLDFAFVVQLDPSSTDFDVALSLGRFPGYTTDVGYIDGSGVVPTSVTSGPFGFGITFKYPSPRILLPGDMSAILVVATNATSYDTSGILTLTRVDNTPSHTVTTVQINNVFEPAFVPEPSTLLPTALLLGLGLLGLSAVRKKTS